MADSNVNELAGWPRPAPVAPTARSGAAMPSMPPPAPSELVPPADANAPIDQSDDDRPDRRRPSRFVTIAAVVTVVGGIAGGLWMSLRSPVYEAQARVSFIDWIEPGATDAERARILDLGNDAMQDQVAAIDPSANVDTSAPAGRNFIDVIVTSSSRDDVADAARVGAEALVDGELDDTERRLIERTEAAQESADALIPVVEAHEAEMAVFLEREAAAQALKNAGDDSEAVMIELQEADDAYWKVVRERNSVLDQQNEFMREALRLEAQQRAPLDFELTSTTRDAIVIRESSLALGVVGGALTAAAAMLLLWVARSRRVA